MLPSLLTTQLRESLLDYLTTTLSLADDEVERALFDFLAGDNGLFQGPLVNLRLPFRKALEGEKPPLEIAPPFTPYAHQLEAFERLHSSRGHQPQHTLVTTGTGSGKTECFLYPILDHCYRNRDKQGIKAIILYPMNALASDQARRIAQLISQSPLDGQQDATRPVRAGLYVGGHGSVTVATSEALIDDRDTLRLAPPDILLTNYKMLDFLLLRPEDRPLWQHNGPDTLRYLVLDELHTYDGAQGSDVACLIRRLKARHSIEPGKLCCVGTSATIGNSEKDTVALNRFASRIFGEPFGRDSVIREDRYTIEEALGHQVHEDVLPDLNEDVFALLDPFASRDLEDYIARQQKVWFGLERPCSNTDLTDHLKRHPLLRLILRALDGKQRDWEAIDRALRRRLPILQNIGKEHRWSILQSFLALVSHARVREGKRTRPFLDMQLQLWVRELRRMVQKVDTTPTFAWEEEVEADDIHSWLPLVYCRECGECGFGARRPMQSSTLDATPRAIGESYLKRARESCFVRWRDPSKTSQSQLFGQWIDPTTLEVFEHRAKPNDAPHLLPVEVDQSLDEKQRFVGRCPACESDGALRMLGSRATIMSSVMITQLFGSEFNKDRKLLAFTDSVQDASHRAGFFGARTYRFNLRVAIQSAIDASKTPLTLEVAAEHMLRHWERDPRHGTADLVAALSPPDLRELRNYRSFIQKPGRQIPPGLRDDLITRLSWEITSEFGLYAGIGRSLEQSACASVMLPEDPLASATATMQADLAENSPVYLITPPELDACRHFLEGFLERLRSRGAIFNGILKNYIDANGARFMLSRQKNPLFPPTGPRSRLPKFATLQRTHKTFESLFSEASRDTWYRDWASRTLGCDARDTGINELYKRVVLRACQSGLLDSVRGSKGAEVYGLDPKALTITTSVRQVSCASCGQHALLPEAMAGRWEGKPCTRFRCDGSFALDAARPEDYYARLYRSDNLERIFTAEHTGLLERQEREELEAHFQNGDTPEAPNLVVCTPTLEMGIDIGDLSAVMLCSVPRTVASYQQRVGRAGRKTGNALTLTVVEPQPHALYFFAEPLEMTSGEVPPPGCFLDAPEILKRQLVAFAFDHWTLHDQGFDELPADASSLMYKGGQDVLPGRFLEHIEEHREDLLGAFLSMFDGELSQSTITALSTFARAKQLDALVQESIDDAVDELEELRRQLDRLTRRIKRLSEQVTQDPTLQEELDVATEGKQVTTRHNEERGARYILNVLGDGAALPNYAFPEAGVTLRSTIRLGKNKAGKHAYRSAEYLRPGPVALRELAPFNTFYAKGNKVVIDQIDMGSSERPFLETWRFCERCHHHELDTGDEELTSCPKCNHTGWRDSGQRRGMVRFRRALAYADALDAVISDSDEDRDRRSYSTMHVIEVGQEHWGGAQVLESLPFGFELLRDLELRELNCGLSDHYQSTINIAGQQVPTSGFVVCQGCGKVQHKQHRRFFGKDFFHAPACKLRNKPDEESMVKLYLYRELKSEAVRLLLPVAVEKIDRYRASFQAALSLGLREKYGGHPDHLGVTFMSEPIEGHEKMRRNFLLLYDRIPGGTGYLRDLAEFDTLMEVFEASRRALETCRCRADGARDGCHRCLYAFQPSRDIPNISSKLAIQVLGDILAGRGAFKEVTTLSKVSVDERLESELEVRFVTAIAEWCKQPRLRGEIAADWSFERTILRGEIVYRITVAGRTWRLEPQVTLGPEQGVRVTCRPDFILRCTSDPGASLPIAIFCDGWEYHAQPSQATGRIWDDIVKRQAILDSGEYHVWSLSWQDVEAELDSTTHPPRAHALFAGASPDMVGKAMLAIKSPLPAALTQQSCFEQLMTYVRHPGASTWQRATEQILLTTTMGLLSPPLISLPSGEALLHGLQQNLEMPSANDPGITRQAKPPAILTAVLEGPYSLALVRGALSAFSKQEFDKIALWFRLEDRQDARKETRECKRDWWRMLQAWNMGQFLKNCHMLSSEYIDHGEYMARLEQERLEEESELQVDDTRRMQRDALLDFAMPECEALIEACAMQEDVPLPSPDDVGFELRASGRIVGLAELAWPALKVVVLLEEQAPARDAWSKAGWRAFTLDETETILAALRQAG